MRPLLRVRFADDTIVYLNVLEYCTLDRASMDAIDRADDATAGFGVRLVNDRSLAESEQKEGGR